MKVPEGMKVYRGRHKYKAGKELPASIGKKLEDRIKEKGDKVQKKKLETEAKLKKDKKSSPVSPVENKDSDK
jgi:hypothetical protein